MPNTVDILGYSYQSGRWVAINAGAGGEIHMVGYGENRIIAIKNLYHERITATATAGSNTISGAAVPAGVFRCIQNMAFRDQQTALTGLTLYATDGTQTQVVLQVGAVTLGFWTPVNGLQLWIPAGWFIRAGALGCALSDNLYFEANGFDMTA